MENKGQPTKVVKTWFIQRGDDPEDIFACDEQEAWGLFANRSNWMRKDFKIIGVSDGKTYVKTLKEGTKEIEHAKVEVQSIARDLKRFNETKDRMKFDDLLPDDDEKVIRVNKLLEIEQEKYDKVSEKINNAQKYVVDNAFKAELEVARGNIEQPQNFDVFTPHGNRDRILKQLGQ